MLSKVGNINRSYYRFSIEIFHGNHICSQLKMGLLWLKRGGGHHEFHEFQSFRKVSIVVLNNLKSRPRLDEITNS